MNLAIPRGTNTDLLLYLWKIIDLPDITLNHLLYKISYELALIPPDKAIIFVNDCLNKNLLTKDDNEKIRLSKALNEKLETWQKERKKEILKKKNNVKEATQITNNFEKAETTRFNILLKSFVDKGTVNRAANISSSAFNIKELDTTKGIVKSTVSGSKEEPYHIEININEKILKHNCHDFETRRSKNKHFCKHLVRFFLLLREKNEDLVEFFLKDLAENIEKWEFSS
ncbi:MAG: hypothetical protein ACFFBC_02280 [Promethearchaeota archaeon]